MKASNSKSAAATEGRKRFAEPAKFLPIAFICFTITMVYTLYLFFHCIPMLQFDVDAIHRDESRRNRGITQTIIFHFLTSMLVICYVRSILEHPGEIPNDDLWNYSGDGRTDKNLQMNTQEVKKSGDRRHCKWCGKYKPDRCHHCRVCRTCILKMDHHCPWIYNCVGFKNYKFFFLLLFYVVSDLHFVVWTMVESVIRSWDIDKPFATVFFTLWGATLSIFMATLLTIFFGFHIALMVRATTTIEFCEKKYLKGAKERDPNKFYETSVYDVGCYGNIKAVLGPNPLMWLIPTAPSIGDGLNYITAETRLTIDLEAGKGVRKKKHQTIQRPASQQYSRPGSEDGQR